MTMSKPCSMAPAANLHQRTHDRLDAVLVRRVAILSQVSR